MRAKIHLNGKERKELVKAIEGITGEKAIYRKVPTCNYDIGQITVLKDATIEYPEGSDIMEQLADAGFEVEDLQNRLTIEIPNDLTPEQLENLKLLVSSKEDLLKKATGAKNLKILEEEGKVKFPWFELTGEAGESEAYMQLVAMMAAMAKKQKRVTAKPRQTDNDKYTFRCFLLRLGFIGDKYKTARRILLRNLHGNTAWRSGHKMI